MTNIENIINPNLQTTDLNEKLKASLDNIALKIPEIAENREIIEKGGQALIEDFNLMPEFFDDEAHSMYFAALAQRNGDLISAIESDTTRDSLAKEKEFIHDAMALVALDKSKNYDQFANLVDSTEETSDEYDRMVYEKYTNQEATDKIKALVDGGLLDAVKSRLGVTPENESHYDIKVLNVGNDYARSEMVPQQPGLFGGDKEVSYNDFLKAANQSFLAESKMGASDVPLAWKQEIDGVKTLVLPLPVAEMISDPEGKIKGDKEQREQTLKELQSIIEHEYVHTQGGLTLDEKSLIGITLEEIRAEEYSGNGQGYQECKIAAMYINVATAFDVIGQMKQSAKGGDCATMFAEISNKLGLQPALELNLSLPTAYLNGDSQIRAAINEHLGGLNGFVARLCENDRFKARSDLRFAEYAGIIGKNRPVEDTMVYLSHYEASVNRMPYAANKLIQILKS